MQVRSPTKTQSIELQSTTVYEDCISKLYTFKNKLIIKELKRYKLSVTG